MTVFLNGRFIPEAEAVVPISDRGFLYGDGLFETLRVSRSAPLWWTRHAARLQSGAELLRIALPWSCDELRRFASELIEKNALPECLLRITVSRGSGARGYSIRGADKPSLALTLHPLPAPPASVRMATATIRVAAHDPLAAIKSANKLAQILARAEAEERGADEALLLNLDGDVAEAASSNVFWITSGTVATPPLRNGALGGVTRDVVLELCRTHQVPTLEQPIARAQLLGMDGAFLTNSATGIVPVSELDAQKLNESPLVTKLQQWYREALIAEANARPT
jgi:branched-chain amino acid aminotransferase